VEPRIAFTTRKDGVHIAYATLGEGPPVVYPPGAFSRLEAELSDPSFLEFYSAIAQDHMLVFWDRHGVGHSDRDRSDFSYDDDVLDMEAVVDALGLTTFPIFGISGGGPIAIIYASRHPQKVTCLVLYGTAANIDSEAASQRAKRAIGDLFRSNWWLGTRAVVTQFVPTAPEALARELSRVLSETSTAEVAAALWEMPYDIENLLPKLNLPTLVLHRLDDKVVPFESGREMASQIRNARFTPLSGENHPPEIGDWNAVFEPTMAFLKEVESGEVSRPAQSSAKPSEIDHLSQRELEVLRLVAAGQTNQQIADALVISLNTARKHVANILDKTGAANRTEASVYAHENGLV
jgi:pimeloyl-ACP methyl ester carboxylesterase/DNA-binding CsgD family transcriptional regulator